ncbi:MAG: hypothetical protein KA734_07600 [Fluviicola sp.]|nr:hypothetical protein [Fluviicola sp.]
MEFILGDVLFTIVGWVSMLIKHRNIDQMRIVIKEKYENQYSSVGREILSNTFLKIFALLLFSLIIVTLVVFIITK